jgi:hypothetical protein
MIICLGIQLLGAKLSGGLPARQHDRPTLHFGQFFLGVAGCLAVFDVPLRGNSMNMPCGLVRRSRAQSDGTVYHQPDPGEASKSSTAPDVMLRRQWPDFRADRREAAFHGRSSSA